MSVIEDLRNELYCVEDILGGNSINSILKILNFPKFESYICSPEEFIYGCSDKMRALSFQEQKSLKKCDEIIINSSEEKEDPNVFCIKISENRKNRNETICEISRIFFKIYGWFTILVFLCDSEILFSGISSNKDGMPEVIISDWYSFNDKSEKLSGLEDIDFNIIFSNDKSELYENYLFSIARKYKKYTESKEYQIFACQNVITNEIIITEQETKEELLVSRIDIEETLRENSSYYVNLYGEDYFVDNNIEEGEEGFFIDEDKLDFELTMLEINLDKEDNTEESDSSKEKIEKSNSDFIQMNPEEMLNFIRNGL